MAEPLFLEPVMQEKIWGGRRLADEYGYEIPSDHTGECWAISAHPNGVATIKQGKFKGYGLDRLYVEQPELFGNPKSTVFPLLTKILDANDWLSVQVHPDDEYAMEFEGELGKTECWYILSADEDSEIIYGHEAETKEELSRMIDEKDWDNLLTRVNVKKGDFFYVPSGTIHAIGKGVMVLETQQSSDTTYRVYDFDRMDDEGKKRELHIPHSIAVSTIGKPANSYPSTFRLHNLDSHTLVSNEFFTVYKWDIKGPVKMKRFAPYLLVSVIEGTGTITLDYKCYPFKKGDHFIIPNTAKDWEIDGKNLEIIASHVREEE